MRIHRVLGAAIAALAIVGFNACTTPPNADGTPVTAAQKMAKYTDDVGRATSLVNEVTVAATAAINADVLKGQDADNAIAAIKVAKDGLALARSLVSTGQLTAEQGSTRIAITLAVLTTSQAYFASLAKKNTPATPGAKT